MGCQNSSSVDTLRSRAELQLLKKATKLENPSKERKKTHKSATTTVYVIHNAKRAQMQSVNDLNIPSVHMCARDVVVCIYTIRLYAYMRESFVAC